MVYQIVEGPVVKVAGIEFRGTEHASVGRLRTQLVTKREFAKFFGGKFNPVSMDLDRQKLIDYYHNLGFLGVQITPEVERTMDVGHVRIVYHIVEGRQYQVAGKEIDGNKSFTTEKLDTLTELKPGERYDLRDGPGGHGPDEELLRCPRLPRRSRAEALRGAGAAGGRPGSLRGAKRPRAAGPRRPDHHRGERRHQEPRDPGTRLHSSGRGKFSSTTDSMRPAMRLARLGIFDPQEPPTVEVLPE